MIYWVAFKALLGSVETKYWVYAGLVVVALSAALYVEHRWRSRITDAALQRVEEGNRDAREKGFNAREKALNDFDRCMARGGVWDRARLVCNATGAGQ